MKKSEKRTKYRLFVGPPSDVTDIQYLTGFAATDPVVLLVSHGGKCLVVPDLEYGRARMIGGGVEAVLASALPKVSPNARGVAAWVLGLMRREGVKAVTVSRWFPASLARRLEAAGIRVAVEENTLTPERAVKRPEEMEHLRSAQRVAIRCMKQAIGKIAAAEIGADGTLRQGRRRLCSEDVREEIERVALAAGCLCAETIVAGGAQAVNPHERGHGPLRAGEAIVLDIFPRDRRTGYWGDLTRTVARGRVAEPLRRMYAAVAKAQRAALAVLRAGVSAETPDRAARRVFEEWGYRTERSAGKMEGFIHGTGHGLGLDIHESPALRPGGGRLRAGHVVTVEPGLYYPGIGGIRIEDVVAITKDGHDPFPTLPRTLELDGP